MIKKEIGEWIVGNDPEATREIYRAMPVCKYSISKGHKKFVKLAPKFPKEVLDFFDDLGVDIKKPCSIEEAKFNRKQKCYTGHYYMVGYYIEGQDIWVKLEDPGHERLDEDRMYPLIDGYKVGFTRDIYNLPVIKNVSFVSLLHMEISFLIEK